jgi:hypothetical protein
LIAASPRSLRSGLVATTNADSLTTLARHARSRCIPHESSLRDRDARNEHLLPGCSPRCTSHGTISMTRKLTDFQVYTLKLIEKEGGTMRLPVNRLGYAVGRLWPSVAVLVKHGLVQYEHAMKSSVVLLTEEGRKVAASIRGEWLPGQVFRRFEDK